MKTFFRFVSTLIALVCTLATSGCASMESAQSAIGLYDSVRNVTSGYHAMTSVKDLTNAQPLFAGYDSVMVLADLRPRENVPNLQDVFASNMAIYTTNVARTVRAPLQVCRVLAQCAGRVLILNFKEDAYDRNLIQRLTVGDQIRGRLLFTDAATARILDEKRAEMGDTYASLAKLTSGFIMGSLYKSFPPASGTENERIGRELQKTPVVAPQFEGVLGRAS